MTFGEEIRQAKYGSGILLFCQIGWPYFLWLAVQTPFDGLLLPFLLWQTLTLAVTIPLFALAWLRDPARAQMPERLSVFSDIVWILCYIEGGALVAVATAVAGGLEEVEAIIIVVVSAGASLKGCFGYAIRVIQRGAPWVKTNR